MKSAIFHRKVLIFQVLYFLLHITLAISIERPSLPVVYGDGAGGIQLYWFYPGLHEFSIGNLNFEPTRGVAGSMSDRQYCIFTRFQITPPFYIRNASTYIMNYDGFPELPGDQMTPVRMSLKEKKIGGIFNDLWFEEIGLAFGAGFPGEYCTGEPGLSVNDIFETYLAVEWLAGTPTAPLIGVNSQPPYLEQYICPMDDSAYQLTYTSACIMVGLDVLQWHRNEDESNLIFQADNDISFDIFFANDTIDFEEKSVIIASADPDSLYCQIDNLSSGYISIRASDGLDKIYSDFRYIDLERLPPISIHSLQTELDHSSEFNNSTAIRVENLGIESLELLCFYDSTRLTLSSESISLEVGAAHDIDIVCRDNSDLNTLTGSPIFIETMGNYYPILFRIPAVGNIPTDLDSDASQLPEEFVIDGPYPNPFNMAVEFDIRMAGNRPLMMNIYNLIGRELLSRRIRSQNDLTVRWDGHDGRGRRLGSGVYFFKFSCGGKTIIKKAILLK